MRSEREKTMARTSYKSALRAKGIKPIPKDHWKLRSYRGDGHVVTACEPEKQNVAKRA
jgi:hypothetical protein